MRVTSSLHQVSLNSDDLLCCWRDVEPFPVVLHRLLGNMAMEGNEHIISWNEDGKSFTIHEPREFADKILTRYFKNQTRYKSFQRQLNLYRFNRISQAKEKGIYAHNSFMRDFPQLCQFVRRTRKQTRENVSGKQQWLPLRYNPDSPTTLRPTPLPSEINLTHSATSDVCSSDHSHGKERIEQKERSTKGVRSLKENNTKDEVCSCADGVGVLTESSSLTPLKGLDYSAITLDYQPSMTGSRDITMNHVHALLATLSPPTGSCPLDSDDLDDNLSIGSIEDFGTTMTPGASIDLSWACRPADVEIFP